MHLHTCMHTHTYIYTGRDMHLHTCMHTCIRTCRHTLHSTPLAHLSPSRSIYMHGEDGSDVDMQAIIMRAKTTPWGGVLVVQGS